MERSDKCNKITKDDFDKMGQLLEEEIDRGRGLDDRLKKQMDDIDILKEKIDKKRFYSDDPYHSRDRRE